MEDFMTVPIFTNDKGEPYRLFVQDCPEREKIIHMIEYGFGTVERCPGGENTVVLAAPGFNTNGREVFSIYYITDCCKRNKKLDIKDFRLNKRSKYTPDFNPMDVLEGVVTWSQAEKFRKKSGLQFWQPDLPIEKNTSFHGGNNNNNNINKNKKKDFSKVETNFVRRNWLTDTSPVISKVRNNELENDDYNDGDSLHLRRQRKYTRAEQEDIVKYVVRHRAYDLVQGTDFWKMMEQYMVCKKRKWHSIKEQFLKKILPDIESYNLSESQISMFKNVRRQIVKHKIKRKEIILSEESPTDEINISRRTDDVSESKQKRKEHEEKGEHFQRRTEEVTESKEKRKEHKEKREHFQRRADDVSESKQKRIEHEEAGFQRNTNYYKEAEDKALLNFIVERKKYYQTGGVLLWKLMERKQVVPGRSWQSMKERYRKVLVNKLNHYFPEDVVQKFKKGELIGSKKETKKRKKRTIEPQCAPQYTSAKNKNCSDHPTLDCMRCFTDGENIIPYRSVATSTPNDRELVALNKHVPKRKLFFQKSGILELTPVSVNEKSVQSHRVLPQTKYYSNEIQKTCSTSKNKDNLVVTEKSAHLPEKSVEMSVPEPFEFSELSVQLCEIQNTGVASVPARDSKIACGENIQQINVPENSDVVLSIGTSTEVTAEEERKIVNETKISITSEKTNMCQDAKAENNVRELRICLTRCDLLATLNHNSPESISNRSSQTNTVPGEVTDIEMNASPGHSDFAPERLIMNDDPRESLEGSISELHTSGDSEDVVVPNMKDIECDERLKYNETNIREISTHSGSSQDKISKKSESVKEISNDTYKEKSVLDFITKEGIWLEERIDMSNENVVDSFNSDSYGEETEISLELDLTQNQSTEISQLESSLAESGGNNVVRCSDSGGHENRDKEKHKKSHTEEDSEVSSYSITNKSNDSKKIADVNDSRTGVLSQRMLCERKETPMGEMSVKGIVYDHIENISEKDSVALVLEKEQQMGTSSTNLQDSKVSERQELYRKKKGKIISVKKIRKKLCTNKFKIKTANGYKYKIRNYSGKYQQRRPLIKNNEVEDRTDNTIENKDTCALNRNFVKSVYAHRLFRELSNGKYKKNFKNYVRSRKEYFPNKSMLHAKQRLVDEKSFIGNYKDRDTLNSTSSSESSICERSDGTFSELSEETDITDLEHLNRNVPQIERYSETQSLCKNTETKSHSQNSVYSSDKESLNASSISLNNENGQTDDKIEYNVQLHDIKTKEIDHLKSRTKSISNVTAEERDSEMNVSFTDENNDSSIEYFQGSDKETADKKTAMDSSCHGTVIIRKMGKRVLSTVHNNHRIIDKNVLGSISESTNKLTLCDQNDLKKCSLAAYRDNKNEIKERKGKCISNSLPTLSESNFKPFSSEEDISRNENQQNSKKIAKTESNYFTSKRHGERTPTRQKTSEKNCLNNVRRTGFKRSSVSVYKKRIPVSKLNLDRQRIENCDSSMSQTCDTSGDINLDNCTAYSDKEKFYNQIIRASSSTIISTSSSTITSTSQQMHSNENSAEKNLDNGLTPQFVADNIIEDTKLTSSDNLDNFNTTKSDYSSEPNEQISNSLSYICNSPEHGSGSDLSKSTELTLSNAAEISYESGSSKQLKNKIFRNDTNCLICSDRQSMEPKVDDVFCDECFCESVTRL